jgi:hypothetical protein
MTTNSNRTTKRLPPPRRNSDEEREYYTKLTASLISRDLEATRKLVATWPTQKVKGRYNEVMWFGMNSTPPPNVKWWAARKKEVTND